MEAARCGSRLVCPKTKVRATPDLFLDLEASRPRLLSCESYRGHACPSIYPVGAIFSGSKGTHTPQQVHHVTLLHHR